MAAAQQVAEEAATLDTQLTNLTTRNLTALEIRQAMGIVLKDARRRRAT